MTSQAFRNAETLRTLSALGDPGASNYFADATPSAKILSMRDRMFLGDSALHTGNQNAPLGATMVATTIGNWLEKNSQFGVSSTLGKIGLLGVSCLITGMTSGSSIGVAGVGRAQLAGGTSRALYGDATLEAGASAVYGAELATANRGTDTTANSYTATGGVYGLLIAHESASGYLLGDTNTAATDSTSPGTAAIIIKAGPGGTSNHQYRSGIVFFSNALYGNDGTTGTSEALSMGKGMAHNWYASSAILSATIRSDGTAVAGHDVAMIFSNDTISFQATASAASVHILDLLRDTVSAGGVNYLTLANARTGTNPTWQAAGADLNAGTAYKTKGTGVHQFFTNGTEALRVASNPASAVNFMQAVGSATGGPVILSFQGVDTNGDIASRGKGTGGGQLQDGAAAVKFQWNTTGIGFNATAPVAKPTLAAAATDLATAITLTNDIRTRLINYGLAA